VWQNLWFEAPHDHSLEVVLQFHLRLVHEENELALVIAIFTIGDNKVQSRSFDTISEQRRKYFIPLDLFK